MHRLNYFYRPGYYTNYFPFKAFAPIRCIPLYILSQLNINKRYDQYEKEICEAIVSIEIVPGAKIVKPSNSEIYTRCNKVIFENIFRLDTFTELDPCGYFCESGNSTFVYKNNQELIKINNFDKNVNSLKNEGLIITQTIKECIEFFDKQ
ncbi:hypothetical protein ma264 [Moumouvirus australiensis]|uniref:Uncharacterized protein n=1 Tax=Moumouvirus australiensis TaxID=2109587 RepID=A0A2P1EL93_9VIRU|nr:hypothetical protein QKC55_gp640 [Moumouvirus australiensis]AVL94650.1 hypothetical protein ma264 [Moumouvirus australiensis]